MTAITEQQRYLSVDDLAARLALPKSTIYSWIAKGYGPPSVRMGKYRRFPIAGVEAFERALLEGEVEWS